MRNVRRGQAAGSQRSLIFERLETRTLLAGNVAAVVAAGDLEITGEAAGNAIQVWQTGPTTWKVQGIATTVNGSHSTFTALGVGSIEAEFPDGNSFIKVFNGTLPSVLHISDLGKDNGTVQLINVTTVFGMDISTGKGTSVISLTNVTVESDGLGISTGKGTSVVSLTNVTVEDGGMGVSTGDGTNAVSLIKVNVEDGGMGISTGSGHNAVSLTGVTVEDGGMGISTGSGTNTVSLIKVNVEIGGFGISTGSGTNVVSLTGVSVGDDGLGISTGDGNNSVTLTNVTVEDDGLGISTGSGHDAIALANVTVAGGLSIDAGGGTDAVSLNKVNVSSSDLSVAVGPGNYDSLAVVNCTADTEEFSDTGGTNGTIIGAANHFATAPIVTGFRWRFGI